MMLDRHIYRAQVNAFTCLELVENQFIAFISIDLSLNLRNEFHGASRSLESVFTAVR